MIPAKLIHVRFIGSDGTVANAQGAIGDRLLDVAQICGQPLEGTCDGQMACSTCHVIVDAHDWSRLPPASAEEEDLLDFAADTRRTSRLACQIVLSPALEGLTVRVPPSYS